MTLRWRQWPLGFLKEKSTCGGGGIGQGQVLAPERLTSCRAAAA